MQKKFLLLIFVFFIFASLILTSSFASATAPILFFSDLTDGPTSGWEQSSTKGAAVSIWGDNLGSTRGSSSLTVCGITLNQDSDFAEWGATTNPQTARGLQRVTFWLNSQMQTGPGTIKVTTSDGTSNEIPFYCRALVSNHIYFVSLSGNNNNNGLSVMNAWKTLVKVRETVNAGDIVYVKGGVYTDIDAQNAMINFNMNHNNGIADKSINLAAYPGELAQMGDGSATTTTSFIRHTGYGGTDTLQYWTFSKLKVHMYSYAYNWDNGGSTAKHYLRFIGIDIRTTHSEIGQGTAFLMGASTGEDHIYLYGNYFHHMGKANDNDPHGYKAHAMYFGGYGSESYIDIGWNEMYKMNGAVQFYGHISTDSIDYLYYHDNLMHWNGYNGCGVYGGGDGATVYTFVKNAWIYNNVCANNAGTGIILGTEGRGSDGGTFYIYNNIFYQSTAVNGGGTRVIQYRNPTLYWKNNIVYGIGLAGYDNPTVFSLAGLPDPTTVNMTGDYNCWYGASSPTWDNSHSLDNTNPQFADLANENFHLQSSSPAINAGTSTVSQIVARDFNGITRPQGSGFDIGAYESPSGNYHPADTNQNGKIEMKELIAFIARWKAGNANINDVLSALDRWFKGS